MISGGTIDGLQADPVSYILAHLAAQYAPLTEESRLQALTEIMNFQRRPHEKIDALLSRFLALRYRAQAGGARMVMSWEG